MGTRSLTYVYNDLKPVMCMYKHYDGSPKFYGAKLAQFLSTITLVHGIKDLDDKHIANGAECLAAQIVCHFKKGPGDVYLYNIPGRDEPELELDQEYEYNIFVNTDHTRIRITTFACDETKNLLFKGTVSKFKNWCEAK